MTEINLLPWREAKREQQKKTFNHLMISAGVLGASIVMIINFYVDGMISTQGDRNRLLEQEINILDGQIQTIKLLKAKRTALISRMNIVQDLQATRPLTIHLFDELVKVLPEGVYLTDVKREKDKITVLGYSESNTNISLMMRNIETNPWIKEPSLTQIKKSDAISKNSEFQLSFILKPSFVKKVVHE